MVSARVALRFVLTALSAVLIAGCQNGDSKATLPDLPADASPHQVVATYTEAINAHDVAAGEKLSTSRFAEEQERVVGLLNGDAKLSAVEIDEPRPEPDYESTDGKRYREVVHVPVSFTLSQSDDASMPNGPVVWGYTLVRDDVHQPWRINSDGID